MSAAGARIGVVTVVALLGLGNFAYGQEPSTAPEPQGHEGHQQPAGTGGATQADRAGHGPAEEQPPPPDLPAITDEDRAAAFPELNGQHAVHDRAVHYYVLFEELEWRVDGGTTAGSWENSGWIGRDLNRFWFRTEGHAQDGQLAGAEAHALLGRAIHPWWDLIAGVRHDFSPDPARTWAALGIQGLAPYWFQVEATAYVGASGRTHFRFESEYELLLTNRFILQPLIELDVYGKSDPERGIGAGLSSGEAGLRLRYEIRRELAPYIGVIWNRTFLGTADLARAAGESPGITRLALGARIWF